MKQRLHTLTLKAFNERAFNSFAPIQLEGFEETWTIQTVLPRSVIIEPFVKSLLLQFLGHRYYGVNGPFNSLVYLSTYQTAYERSKIHGTRGFG